MINWGEVGGWAGALLALTTSIGYAFQHDWRHTLYRVLRSASQSLSSRGDMVKIYSMDDVGTRAEHMADLQDLWSFAYGRLTTEGCYHSGDEDHQAGELKIALDLLMHHMMSEFQPTEYAKVINALPAPEPETKKPQGESNYGIS